MTPATTLEAVPIVPAGGFVDAERYEIVDGKRVELPPMSAFASYVSSNLLVELGPFVRRQKLGRSFVETLFQLPRPVNRIRRPDVAFVSYERWPQTEIKPRDDNAWDVVPNLAVEVVSPSDPAEDLLEKIEEYFKAGVQLVWLIYPRRQVVHVYTSYLDIRGLAATDELTGGAVLPGFRLLVGELFKE